MSIQVLISAALMATALSFNEVELVTITDTSFTLTFVTDRPVIAEVVYGNGPAELDGTESEKSPPTRFHQITVDGLLSGADYYFRIKAESKTWPSTLLKPKSLTTLVTPPGKLLFSFAVVNDIHAREDIAGVMILPFDWMPPLTPGFTWRNPADNYWEFNLRDAVEGINQSGAELCIVNGDLTSWYTREEFEAVKSHLDNMRVPYYVVRGNHDRVGGYPEDYLKAVFGLESSWYSFEHQGFHFVILDDNRLEDGWHGMPDEELQWFGRDLAGHRTMPTFVFMHRPVAAGTGPDLDQDIRARILATIADNPQVAAVFNAHSHQARVTVLPEITGSVPYIEVPANKEYPAGYGVIKVYEGGFMYNFIGNDCADCREWRHITRKEYFGLAPRLQMGELSDRNDVYPFTPEVREMIGH